MADILLFSTADWDHPVWTNKQHVACALNDLGHRVLYVESVGLRGLRQKQSDFTRLIRRLVRAFVPPRQVRPGLWCWSPLVVPGASQPWLMMLNRLLFCVGLGSAMKRLRMKPVCLWTYNPMTLAYYRPKSGVALLYHCVDDIQSQPGMNSEMLSAWEAELCRLADVVYVTSPALLKSREVYNSYTYYLPNVADNQHFSTALDATLAIPADLEVIPEPRLGFVGSISQYKLDFDLIVQVARLRPEWSWVLIGPVGECEASTDLRSLLACENIHILGVRHYRLLPSYLKGCRVGLLPLRKNSYTNSMFPMKFFEYLSAGLPVVATDIDSLREFSGIASVVAPQPVQFEAAIEDALSYGQGSDQMRRRISCAENYTYLSRTMAMIDRLVEVLEKRSDHHSALIL